ncbi:MAG: TonB C-terminal domain-containing protein [Gemmatimonadota bacterium]
MSFSAQGRTAQAGGGVAASVFGSLLLHAGLIAAFLSLRPDPGPKAPPYFRVNLVAAAASPAPAAGVVAPPATKVPPPAEKKAPPRPKTDEVAPVPVAEAPKAADKRATPSVSDTRVDRKAPAPVAGGGEQGSTGADVASITTEGIAFQYPGYLENIVRQIRLRFTPPRGMAALKAEVAFLIRRDGTIMGFRFTQRSGAYTFDLEVQGAVESAAAAFGSLPPGFKDDVLPVVFSFDPRLIR